MAFGSGSSLATDCSTRRRGSPPSLQLPRAGLASLLNQVSSKKPTTHSGRPSARPINRSRRFFSLVLGVGAGYPALSSLPTHPHPLQSGPDGLARDTPFCEPLLETYLGSHLNRPHGAFLSELLGVSVKQLPQSLGPLGIESPVNGVRMLRACLKCLWKLLLVEGVD